jgi:hypothetical protein
MMMLLISLGWLRRGRSVVFDVCRLFLSICFYKKQRITTLMLTDCREHWEQS